MDAAWSSAVDRSKYICGDMRQKKVEAGGRRQGNNTPLSLVDCDTLVDKAVRAVGIIANRTSPSASALN